MNNFDDFQVRVAKFADWSITTGKHLRRRVRNATSKLVAFCRAVVRTIVEWWRDGDSRYPNRREQLRQVRHSIAVSLRHNIPLTIAGVLTTALALALVGGSMTMSAGLDAATARWRDGVETIVFMDPDAPDEFVRSIGAELRAEPAVKNVEFVSQADAYEEFSVMFANRPELVRSVEPSTLPASWRVTPDAKASDSEVRALTSSYLGRDGIYQVTYAADAVASVRHAARTVQLALSAVALALGAAAWMLSVASCRASAWARRDELAVMRLVGAPRWVLRLPFVAEGAIQGVAGGCLAGIVVWKATDMIERRAGSSATAIAQGFHVSGGERWSIVFELVTIGALAGAAGAGIAIGRYVRAREGLHTNLVVRQIQRLSMLRRRTVAAR